MSKFIPLQYKVRKLTGSLGYGSVEYCIEDKDGTRFYSWKYKGGAEDCSNLMNKAYKKGFMEGRNRLNKGKG